MYVFITWIAVFFSHAASLRFCHAVFCSAAACIVGYPLSKVNNFSSTNVKALFIFVASLSPYCYVRWKAFGRIYATSGCIYWSELRGVCVYLHVFLLKAEELKSKITCIPSKLVFLGSIQLLNEDEERRGFEKDSGTCSWNPSWVETLLTDGILLQFFRAWLSFIFARGKRLFMSKIFGHYTLIKFCMSKSVEYLAHVKQCNSSIHRFTRYGLQMKEKMKQIDTRTFV